MPFHRFRHGTWLILYHIGSQTPQADAEQFSPIYGPHIERKQLLIPRIQFVPECSHIAIVKYEFVGREIFHHRTKFVDFAIHFQHSVFFAVAAAAAMGCKNKGRER